ncbi:MAG: diaminopimelate epimerase [Clostridiales Family XIII bacterium]|jgi:diaminopimelate epimerase|nr:diaminopimelate epimerase [Clostridiales Family XIII bacterium]
MHFVKYHGCGNDFLIVNEAELIRAALTFMRTHGIGIPEFVRRICHRQLGVGADGLIICSPAPLAMGIVNSDGSSAPMCGNGIRCFARYCVEEEIAYANPEEFDVDTSAGVMHVRTSFVDGLTDEENFDDFTVEIDMGRPDWSARAAGVGDSYAGEGDEFLGRDVSVDIESPLIGKDSCGDTGLSHDVRLSSFFIGTYHTVVWLDENEWILGDCADAGRSLYESEAIDRVGRALESHPAFTERTNVDFARVTDDNAVEMITWERGAGLTAACGTGACAVAALGIREGRFDGNEEVRVSLPYGELFIRIDGTGEVFMRGPAERVFEGDYYL